MWSNKEYPVYVAYFLVLYAMPEQRDTLLKYCRLRLEKETNTDKFTNDQMGNTLLLLHTKLVHVLYVSGWLRNTQ